MNEQKFNISEIVLAKEAEIASKLYRISPKTKYDFYCEQLASLIHSYTNYPVICITGCQINRLMADIRFHILYTKLCETKLEMQEENKQSKKWQENIMSKFTNKE